MTRFTNIQFRLAELMDRQLHLSVASAQTDLFESGAMDSLVFVELLLLLEREFSINIDMQKIELEDFRSLESISVFVRTQLPQIETAIQDQMQTAVAL